MGKPKEARVLLFTPHKLDFGIRGCTKGNSPSVVDEPAVSVSVLLLPALPALPSAAAAAAAAAAVSSDVSEPGISKLDTADVEEAKLHHGGLSALPVQTQTMKGTVLSLPHPKAGARSDGIGGSASAAGVSGLVVVVGDHSVTTEAQASISSSSSSSEDAPAAAAIAGSPVRNVLIGGGWL